MLVRRVARAAARSAFAPAYRRTTGATLCTRCQMTSPVGWSVQSVGMRGFAAAAAHTTQPTSQVAKGNEMHFRDKKSDDDYVMPHPVWTEQELNSVQITHKPPEGMIETLAYYTVKTLKTSFDIVSGFRWGTHNEAMWTRRIIFLETVAGVPGMVAAGVRHLRSLRMFQRDHGWIHTLLEDAENERMHLLTALQLRQPGMLFRACVIGAQGVFVTWFFGMYLISPRFCHRFVAYLEETAVETYTQCLHELDTGGLPQWAAMTAPPIAQKYWRLGPDATMRDLILNIRADECHHKNIHHTFADLTVAGGGDNPFMPGSHEPKAGP